MSREERASGVLVGVATFIGSVIGLTTGLIMAPQSGEKTQAMIKETFHNVVESAGNVTETINEKAGNLYSRTVEEVSEVPGQVKEDLKDTASAARGLYTSRLESGKAYLEDIKSAVLSSIDEVRSKYRKEKIL